MDDPALQGLVLIRIPPDGGGGVFALNPRDPAPDDGGSRRV
jgi:hypothetical protein